MIGEILYIEASLVSGETKAGQNVGAPAHCDFRRIIGRLRPQMPYRCRYQSAFDPALFTCAVGRRLYSLKLVVKRNPPSDKVRR